MAFNFQSGIRPMEFDRHLVSPARLSIVAALFGGGNLSFTELKKVTGLADGNLHAQTRRLEECGYLVKTKESSHGRPVTFFGLSSEGVEAFELFIRKLNRILDPGRPLPGPILREEPHDAFRVW